MNHNKEFSQALQQLAKDLQRQAQAAIAMAEAMDAIGEEDPLKAANYSIDCAKTVKEWGFGTANKAIGLLDISEAMIENHIEQQRP